MDTPTIGGRGQLRQLLPNLTAGLVTGVIAVILELSFATLIFSGPLAAHVGNGVGLLLFGAVVIGVVVAWTSSLSGTLAGPQDSPAAILALMAAAIAESMSATASSDAILSTVTAAIAVSSLLTGIVFLLLGRFKLGRLVRFAPYPVIGGFLAGTGWLLVLGAMGVMTTTSLTFATLGDLFQVDVLVKWLAGALFAVLLLIVLRRYNHFLIMPAMLVGAVSVFYAAMLLTNTSLDAAAAHGWLLGPFPQGSLWQPITPTILAQVNWSVVVAQMDKIGTIIAIAVISLLLNSNGLELALKRDIDLDRELESAGVANLLAGLGAGPAGYHFLSDTVLSYKMGARGRGAALAAAAVCAVVLVFGASLVSIFPRPVLGGLLLFLGLAFLSEWVYDAWFTLSRLDYILVLTILVIIAAAGFLQGVAAGVGIAVALFVVNYSRVQVVRHTLSGSSFHSTMDRPPSQRQFLREHGAELEILQLQGFLFFGTAQTLLDQIRPRAVARDLPRLRFLVLDFGRTTGLDSSAVSCFVKLREMAEANQLRLVLTSVSGDMRCQLERGGLGRDSNVDWAPTLDTGVERCEDEILATANTGVPERSDDLPAQLASVFPQREDVARLLSYFEPVQVGAREWLVRQGEPGDALYFIGDGLATAHLELPDGRTVRLRTMRCGTTIGEVGLYLGATRTASVRTEEPSTLYRLSAEAIRQMERRDPELAAALHRWVARLMAERLAENNNALAAMVD